MTISGFLYVLLMLALIAALAEHGENRRLRARLEARRIREGYPWDWTRESERKAQAALELICDKCHEPRRCSQDELDEACAMCPVPDAVYRLAAAQVQDYRTSAAALARGKENKKKKEADT